MCGGAVIQLGDHEAGQTPGRFSESLTTPVAHRLGLGEVRATFILYIHLGKANALVLWYCTRIRHVVHRFVVRNVKVCSTLEGIVTRANLKPSPSVDSHMM